MALNCKNIIVSAFKITEPQLLEYSHEFQESLEAAHPGSFVQRVKIVPQQHFVQEVLADPASTFVLTETWAFVIHRWEWSKVQS